MPTATDVDNRPVAIGKWPRLRTSRTSPNGAQNNALRRHGQQHVQQPQGQHSDWCTLDNCVHNCDEDSSNIDVLLHPELLQEFYGDKCSSANPLLEFCLDGGFSKKLSSVLIEDEINAIDKTNFGLLSHCSKCSEMSSDDIEAGSQFIDQLKEILRQTGCDINVQDSQGLTALHHLIQGCSKENVSVIIEATQLLLSHKNLRIDFQDTEDSPLTSLHQLLDRDVPQESLVQLASTLLAHFNPNHINGQDRTLLTYTVALGDSAIELSRCLLNNGASVLPPRSTDLNRDRSAFTWLLKSLMNEQRLAFHLETIHLLCQNMTEVNGPEVMRCHILSSMIHLGHTAPVMAPLFLELRSIVQPYWCQPLTLGHLARSSIRGSLKKDVAQGVTQLNLPPSLSQYLHYYFQ